MVVHSKKDDFSVRQQKEVDENFKIFQEKLLGTIPSNKYGKVALMRHGEIIDYFNTSEDAIKAGELVYKDGIFSVQKVTREVIDLGYYSHAVI